MNNAELFNELKNRHIKFEKRENSLEAFSNEMNFYESFIPYFFSKNGEADNIKNMYENINYDMEDHCEKSISCIDVNRCYDVYKEYVDGMMKFIVDICENGNNDKKLDAFESKLDIAKNNDAIFIESLYAGKIPDYTIHEKPLSEAVQNIEFLIDFIPQLSVLKENCSSLANKIVDCETTNKRKEELLIESMGMLYNSIDQYCYGTLYNILTDYQKINNVLEESAEPSYPKKKKDNDAFVLL